MVCGSRSTVRRAGVTMLTTLTPVLREYLKTRKIYFAQAGGKSFDSKKATPSRVYMYNYGNSLAQENPVFDRIWQRLLIQEVED